MGGKKIEYKLMYDIENGLKMIAETRCVKLQSALDEANKKIENYKSHMSTIEPVKILQGEVKDAIIESQNTELEEANAKLEHQKEQIEKLEFDCRDVDADNDLLRDKVEMPKAAFNWQCDHYCAWYYVLAEGEVKDIFYKVGLSGRIYNKEIIVPYALRIDTGKYRLILERIK